MPSRCCSLESVTRKPTQEYAVVLITGLSEPRDVSRYAVVVMAPVVSVEWESVAEAVSAVEPKSEVALCRGESVLYGSVSK